MSRKSAHLEMIQSVVRRMTWGSRLVKLWSLLIASALMVLAADARYARFGWLALFMAIAFWVLDAHYLRQRRLFVATRQRVERLDEAAVDFSMDTAPVDDESSSWGSVLLSKAAWVFHCSVIGGIGVARLLAR
jgi:hypothetical protein